MAISSNGTGLIQALGIGSGLDIQSLVSQLVTAEAAPVQNRLARQSSEVGTQLSAMGTLRGALAGFQSALEPLKDAALFDVLRAQSTDDDIFTATADSNAVAGSYDIEVEQLAKSEQLISSAFAGGATSVVGDGTLTLTLGTTSFAVAISSTANTLADVRDAINASSLNPGIRATLVYGQTGARLVLASTQTGAANTIRVATSGGNGGLAQLTYAGGVSPNYTLNQAAQDAIVHISGVEHHSASNTLGNAIDGVAITLKDSNAGSTETLTVSHDGDAVAANVRRFVTAYNALRAKFDTLSFYDAATRTSGPLLGDPMMNGIESQLRRLTATAVGGLTGDYTSLAAIGITSDAKGKLVVNNDKLDQALAADRGAIAKLFGASNGVAARLDTALTEQLASSGSMAARDRSLAAAQKAITDEGQRHQVRMQAVQQRYIAQFSALDTLMQQMNQTSTFLTRQLAQLDNSSGS